MSSVYTSFISKVAFPIHERLKSHRSVAIRKSLEKSQWQTRDQIIASRDIRLAQFIATAYNDVPYVKSLLDSLGLQPTDIQGSEDLSKLPFFTKDTIKSNFEQLKSVNAGVLAKGNTGGSSGKPLTFLLGKDRVSHDVAQKWRATRWWGVDIGDKELVAWGSPIELGSQDRVRRLRDGIFRSFLLPAFDLTKQTIDGFIKEIISRRPAMLFGYPSVYAMIARQAKEHEIKLDKLGIKVVFVTSERLYEHQREIIEQVFGCQVANGYGGRDAGFIAHQCPKGNMHLSAEDIVVEIIDEKGNVLPDGQRGEIVVTHLASGDFPFIRYRTGDIATISKNSCACGRGLPVLEAIDGRSTDFVVAQDGRKMHGLALIYILRELEAVNEFKIVQHTLDNVQVDVVSSSFDSVLSTQIVDGFKARLGSGVSVDVRFVESIASEKSGKFRYVISHVA